MLLCLCIKILTATKLSQTIYKLEVVGEYGAFYRLCVKMDLVISYALRRFLFRLYKS